MKKKKKKRKYVQKTIKIKGGDHIHCTRVRFVCNRDTDPFNSSERFTDYSIMVLRAFAQ